MLTVEHALDTHKHLLTCVHVSRHLAQCFLLLQPANQQGFYELKTLFILLFHASYCNSTYQISITKEKLVLLAHLLLFRA